MKRIICLIICFLFFTGCSVSPQNIHNNKKDDIVKSVWITYYELSEFIKNRDENEFKNKIDSVFSNLKKMGFNTVTVQIRPCADAFYKSSYFPSSEYAFGKQGGAMPYDPLSVMCYESVKIGIKLEAWINPYRVSQQGNIEKLCSMNLAKKWKNSSKVYICDNKIYFNPASEEVTKLIINGVKEVVKNYCVSAIHFDDYFYPTTKKDIDSSEYRKYREKGGKLSLDDWRRENVSILIKGVYNAIKSINPKVKFGVSPAANTENDYNELYADVKKWSVEKGYIDYICPQIYFGFKNQNQPFMLTAKKWLNMSKRDLYVGLPLYKCGKKDEYASVNKRDAIDEFKNNTDIISRQIIYLEKCNGVKGIYIFSYGSLVDKSNKEEVENLLKALHNSSLQPH